MSTPHPSAPAVRPTARSPALLAATWLVATVLAAAVAWWAMTAVGGERRADGAGLVSQARVEQLLAAQGVDPTVPAPVGPTPSTGPTPSPDVGPAPAGADVIAPPPPPPPPPAAGPTDAGAAAPAAGEVARTWDVTGGQVGAVCTGATIALLYATPADGWTVEVERAGPDELEVEMSRDDAESRVRAQCVAGTPQITRGERSGDGGEGGGGGGGGGGDGGGDDRGRAGEDEGEDDDSGDGDD